MDIFTTIITGVVVFTLGQALLKLVIEPVQKLKVTISNVTFCLKNDYVHFMNSETYSAEENTVVYKRLRELGSKLYADLCIIPWYSKHRKLFLLPEFDNVVKASDKLFSMSNWQSAKRNDKYERIDLYRIQICKLLGIHLQDDEPTEEILKEGIEAHREIHKNV